MENQTPPEEIITPTNPLPPTFSEKTKTFLEPVEWWTHKYIKLCESNGWFSLVMLFSTPHLLWGSIVILCLCVFLFLKYVYRGDASEIIDTDEEDAEDAEDAEEEDYDGDYPPINRSENRLEDGIINITYFNSLSVISLDAYSTTEIDSITLIFSLEESEEPHVVGAPVRAMVITSKKPQDYYFPPFSDVLSDISSFPALKVKVEDIEMKLTNEELYRYVNHILHENEFLELRDKFGIHSMIDDRYYDEDDGECWTIT